MLDLYFLWKIHLVLTVEQPGGRSTNFYVLCLIKESYFLFMACCQWCELELDNDGNHLIINGEKKGMEAWIGHFVIFKTT